MELSRSITCISHEIAQETTWWLAGNLSSSHFPWKSPFTQTRRATPSFCFQVFFAHPEEILAHCGAHSSLLGSHTRESFSGRLDGDGSHVLHVCSPASCITKMGQNTATCVELGYTISDPYIHVTIGVHRLWCTPQRFPNATELIGDMIGRRLPLRCVTFPSCTHKLLAFVLAFAYSVLQLCDFVVCAVLSISTESRMHDGSLNLSRRLATAVLDGAPSQARQLCVLLSNRVAPSPIKREWRHSCDTSNTGRTTPCASGEAIGERMVHLVPRQERLHVVLSVNTQSLANGQGVTICDEDGFTLMDLVVSPPHIRRMDVDSVAPWRGRFSKDSSRQSHFLCATPTRRVLIQSLERP